MYRRMVYDAKTLPDPRQHPLDCWIASKDEAGYPHKGFINYIAPEVSRGTASRELRGVIENPGFRLTPGDSVRVKVSAGPPKKQITVPEIAVGIRQQQKFVYVVVNGVAEFRPVVVGPVREVNGVRLQVIEKGLTANDMVVVNGLLRVRPGAPVNAKEQTMPVAPK
jgi:multidrug efflux pump subunit AcrA (membrane-fusion protein)